MRNNFIEDNLLILSKQTMDLFLKQDNPADLISLYTFYYYTAKWQKTNQPKASTAFVAKALHWGKDRVIKVKKILEELGLITNVRHTEKKTKKVIGWFIRLNYLWKSDEKTEEPHSSEPEGGFQDTNALSANNKMLSPVSYETERSSNGINSLGSVLKQKYRDLIAKSPSNKITTKFQAYAVEAADLAGLKNGGRSRLFSIFKKNDFGHAQLEKTKQVVCSPIFKKLITEDQKVRYLAGAYKKYV